MRRIGQRGRTAGARDLLDRYGCADAIGAGAAIRFRKRDAHQAQLAHLAERLGWEFAGLVHMACLRRDLLLGELAHRLADHPLLVGQLEIHEKPSLLASSTAVAEASIPYFVTNFWSVLHKA